MKSIKSLAALGALILLSSACIGRSVQLGQKYLSEDKIIDLMGHPKKWDGKTVMIKIFPYDNGFRSSYVVCFETCDKDYAARSPFIILTSEGRFTGYKGDRPVILNARYSSVCFYTKAICADNRFGEFTEIP
jgi:hypothetical protein